MRFDAEPATSALRTAIEYITNRYQPDTLMLKEIRMENWKSYQQSTLYLDPLTVLIGTNASGKSNALDAFQFLSRSVAGLPINTILQGDNIHPGLRGGKEWACREGSDRFALEAVVGSDDANTEFVYRLEVVVAGVPQIYAESLKRTKYRPRAGTVSAEINLFTTDACSDIAPAITARLYNTKTGKPRPSGRQTTILSQLYPEAQAQSLRAEICEGVIAVNRALSKIFILDPIPSHMRGYTALSADLDSDAANIAGVIAALGAEQKAKVEATLTDYVGQLPERDIRRIYADTVGRFNSDAMLYCDEQWGKESLSVDARGMSDGTLRFLAILVALLVRPKSSLLIVEEIDNGLHPSRAKLLLDVLKTIGKERAIDILVTTHNPALLDNLGPEMTPFITISHREEASGSSHLALLEDIAMLPKLLSAGPVGTLASQGRLEAALKQEVMKRESGSAIQ